MNSDVQAEYCRRVKKALRCTRSTKKFILEQLAHDVGEFLSEHPDADLQGLTAEFGAPEAYAREFVLTESDGWIYREMTARRKRSRICFVVLLTVLALLAVYATSFAWRAHNSLPSYYSEEIVD